MHYTGVYNSPLGELLLASSDTGLCGLWFRGQKYFAAGLDGELCEQETKYTASARQWLDAYFAGNNPDFLPELCLEGTDFQLDVWTELLHIPYGQTTTYGAIARTLAERKGRSAMSAQAVGGAVGRNPIAIIIPCHRVLGAKGSLTGYAAGCDVKRQLLALEGHHRYEH